MNSQLTKLQNYLAIILIALCINYINASSSFTEGITAQLEEQKLKDQKLAYEIKIFHNESKEFYEITSSELLRQSFNGLRPNIQVKGSVQFASVFAAEAARFRLATDTIDAISPSGQRIKLLLKGYLNDQPLGVVFTAPKLQNQNQEVFFLIEGYIDPSSFKTGLDAGVYNFSLDPSILIIDFVY